MRSRRLVRAWAATVLAAPALVLLAVPAPAQGIVVPEMTTDGEWNGSWARSSPNERIALFVRGDAAAPEIRVRYRDLRRPDAFETDWSGRASYHVEGDEAEFSLQITERDKDRIRCVWKRSVPWAGGVETESATVTIFRTDDGRKLAVTFEDLHRLRSQEGVEPRSIAQARLWTFRKVSRRVVRWEEILF